MATKLQSAMEYLMTYGWAILIIAVVLGALFQLGIFNASTFTPKAPPGACHVFRPNGPMTTSFINLQGICNGELPQYVASFNGGASSQITTGINFALPATMSISFWIYLKNAPLSGGFNPFDQGLCNDFTATAWSDGSLYFYQSYSGCSYESLVMFPAGTFEPGKWMLITITRSASPKNVISYLNGALQNTATYVNAPAQVNNVQMTLGKGYTANSLYGYMSNMQVYNATLSANEITALYNEGIGGAPVKLNNLVGWWPLNGDAKDYSGNNKNGVTSAVTFTSNWESGYSTP